MALSKLQRAINKAARTVAAYGNGDTKRDAAVRAIESAYTAYNRDFDHEGDDREVQYQRIVAVHRGLGAAEESAAKWRQLRREVAIDRLVAADRRPGVRYVPGVGYAWKE